MITEASAENEGKERGRKAEAKHVGGGSKQSLENGVSFGSGRKRGLFAVGGRTGKKNDKLGNS